MEKHFGKFGLIAKIEMAVIVILVICIGVLAVRFFKKEEAVPAMTDPVSVSDQDMPAAEEPDKIFLDEGDYGEIWLPVLPGVPVCSYDMDKLVHRNGRMYYEENGVSSALGVDVSEFQGEIDWETVKASGIDFAIIRAGFRGYESGRVVADTMFHQNMDGAIAAGLDVGIYFYSQAVTPEEAREEAVFTMELAEGYDLTYPVVYDWEVVTGSQARTDGISVDALTACTVAFCETLEEGGFHPMVYQNKRTSLLKLDLQQLTDYDFWLAEYREKPTYYYHYDMWQYCSDGTVPGISGTVDMNICFKEYGDGGEDDE